MYLKQNMRDSVWRRGTIPYYDNEFFVAPNFKN